jgi:hypothetical protein
MKRRLANGALLVCFATLSLDAIADAYDSPYGEWRGQTEYQAMVRSASDPAAHAVIDLVVDIDPRGKLTGSSPENGCRMLGIAKPGVTPNNLRLNVTLRNCQYARFNRLYIGYMIVSPIKKYSLFSLQAIDVTPGSGGASFTIESTMRR